MNVSWTLSSSPCESHFHPMVQYYRGDKYAFDDNGHEMVEVDSGVTSTTITIPTDTLIGFRLGTSVTVTAA